VTVKDVGGSATTTGVDGFNVFGQSGTHAASVHGQTQPKPKKTKPPKPLVPVGRPLAPDLKPLKPTLRVRPGKPRARRATKFRFTASIGKNPLRGAVVKFAGKTGVTDSKGHLTIVARLKKARRYKAVIKSPVFGKIVATVKARKPKKH
jgi:hypothetical protein